MTDTFDKEKRSEIMRLVKNKGNKSTELRLIAFFRNNHITGWRRAYPLFGKPDFVFPAQRIVIFVDGCFWHGHNCRNTKPKNNEAYWTQKIERNRKRDLTVGQHLISKKWLVIRLWECQLKDENIIKSMLKSEFFGKTLSE